jgi:nucleotide-binding universal stress UspA family protein
MRPHKHTTAPESSPSGTLLFVIDPTHDQPPMLDFAWALAQRHHAELELVHVVDPGQMSATNMRLGVQSEVAGLARNLKHLKASTSAILLFGKAEQVLRERAEDSNAILIAIALNGSATDREQRKLGASLAHSCDCPVVMVPPDVRAADSHAFSIPNQAARRMVS